MFHSTKLLFFYSLVLAILSCQQPVNTSLKGAEATDLELPFYDNQNFTPQWFKKGDKALKGFHAIGDFELLNQDGLIVNRTSLNDRIVVANFFFTICPGICTKMNANMATIQQDFIGDSDVLLLSHSVLPLTDSVPRLKTYAEEKGVVAGKWHLLTGDKSTIYDLGRNHYMVEEDLGEVRNEDDFLHSENLVLLDKNGRIRGIYNGLNRTAIDLLKQDIKTLKSEDV